MTRRREAGLFAWPLILVAALTLLVPPASAQISSCAGAFDSTDGTLSGFDNVVQIINNVNEKASTGAELYTVSWIDCENVVPPQITDADFTKYFTINDTEACSWVVSVNEPLIGVPDYPDPTESISTTVTFTGFTSIQGFTACAVMLKHDITDQNTQSPEPEESAYTVDIKEDLSPGYTIAGFNTSVQDKDQTSPNNQFSVLVENADCPLEATQDLYTSGQYPQQVQYQLNQAVDYEATKTITCTITFKDGASPPLGGGTTITINVLDANDEPPIFANEYYYSQVSSVVMPGAALDIQPAPISASDGDTDINDPITYSMRNANEDVDGMAYFAINTDTGEVTLTQDLPEDFLLNERVLFFVEAQEPEGAQVHVVLEVMLPWVNLVCGGFHFEQAMYKAEIFNNTSGDVVRVVAVSNDSTTATTTYSLSGTGVEYFAIDPNTGIISVNEANKPPAELYTLEALATITTVPTQHDTTTVTIHVLPFTEQEVVIRSSVIRVTADEGDDQQDLADITLSIAAAGVCVTGAEPSNLKDRFTIEKKSDTLWTLKKTGSLDYEETQEVTVSIRAFKDTAPTCSDFNGDISSELLKSEALAIVTINDINDEAPEFTSDSLVAGYPTNEGLKRVVGPVVSVHADDKDSDDVRYSVTGTDAAKFTVDEVTGDVYGVEGLTCDGQCEFSVKASDTDGKEDQVSVKVLPLDTGHVFTIDMPNTALSDVDTKLQGLSDAAGAQISMLYVSPTETTATRWGRTRYRRDTTTNLKVHVYSIKDGELMSQGDLNSALQEGDSTVQAQAFIDADVFAEVEEVDTTGLKVAVGVLGGLLGVVLIAGVAFFIYQRKKGSSGAKTQKQPTPISTLGQAYHNPSYTNDTTQVNLGSGSVGHKSNGSLNGYPGGGSLNGYTSAEVHRHADQDSPPLHRSPLAPPVDAIPLRTHDSHQQGGLKRTDPGTPEFYGSSSPAPPPSFASSSSQPIYAEVKKPKPSTTTDRKYLDNSDDDEDLGDTKFASVRRSPPPRRSAKPDDDDDDADGDVAYPGGKHIGFQDEPAEDEKKSVAFKVKVETKEIEAENKGPAQKKAEAAALMEANRQKMQEEGDDEDDDEDEEELESMKL